MQTYGGGIWRTWFDRDLGLAGKIVYKDKETEQLKTKLWDSKLPLINIPSLCIHFERSDDFQFNKENHLKPILATACMDQLIGEGIEKIEDDIYNIHNKHFLTFIDRIAVDLDLDIN